MTTTARPPLAHNALGRTASAENAGLTITDHGVTGLLVLRVKPERVELVKAVETVLGVALPGALQSATVDLAVVRWMSPDAWLISLEMTERERIEAALVQALDGHGAVVDVSGGYAHIELSGPSVLEVLKTSTAYDVHPDNFVPGKVVGTTFAKATVLLRALGGGSCEVLVRRSLADYVLLWLDKATTDVGMRYVNNSE